MWLGFIIRLMYVMCVGLLLSRGCQAECVVVKMLASVFSFMTECYKLIFSKSHMHWMMLYMTWHRMTVACNVTGWQNIKDIKQGKTLL